MCCSLIVKGANYDNIYLSLKVLLANGIVNHNQKLLRQFSQIFDLGYFKHQLGIRIQISVSFFSQLEHYRIDFVVVLFHRYEFQFLK